MDNEMTNQQEKVKVSELTGDQEIYWVRTNESGIITAALVERYFSEQELCEELADMRSVGPVKRILTSRVTVGEQLKQSAD